MSQAHFIRPAYARKFRCIGSECEDTCCQGWSVPIDRATYEKYKDLPSSLLRAQLDSCLVLSPPGKEGLHGETFARIRMTGSNQCPLLTENRLCRIQLEQGEAFLSEACASYPRVVTSIGGVAEMALAMSCPEAARQVLLAEDLLAAGPDAEDAAIADQPWLFAIRDVVVGLIRNRAYPLWQRMFLVGILCRRLDAIGRGEFARGVPQFLCEFEATVASGSLHGALDALPAGRTAQLDVVLRLAGMLLHRSNVRPRFVECIQAFTTGIGNGPQATLDSLACRFTEAHDRCYAPFFDRHPHMLENYLLNTVFRWRFPFGREAARSGAQPQMTKEFVKLAAQFALMKGLLIGVAGFHGEKFAAGHVVLTVQAATKHFDHHPEFLNLAYDLLSESGLDGARGLAMLLRNTEPVPAAPAARPASESVYAPAPSTGRPEPPARPLAASMPLPPARPMRRRGVW